jgi:hypothetical protein
MTEQRIDLNMLSRMDAEQKATASRVDGIDKRLQSLSGEVSEIKGANKTPDAPQPRRWPQMWISLSSALIALCALGFSIYQGFLQRQFLKLSVRPRMTISFFYNNDGAGFMFGGTGIGYATMKTFEVLVDGKPQSSWIEMCRTLGFASPPRFEFTVPRPETVFKPDTYNKVFWIPSGPQSDELKSKAGRIFIRTCYCSVFDECWRVDTHDDLPERINLCPKSEIPFTSPPRS